VSVVEHVVTGTKPSRSGGGSGPVRYVERVPGRRELAPGRYERRVRRIELALGWSSPLLLFGAWELLSRLEVLDNRFWPPPTRVLSAGIDMFRDGYIQPHLLNTLGFLLLGYVIGAVSGVLVGLLLGSLRYVRAALDPIISIFYTIPSIALLPFLLLLFGLGSTPKVILVASHVFFVVAVSVTAAMLRVPAGYLEVADSAGASAINRFRHVTLPFVMPPTFVALRITAAMSVLVIVAIEFVQGNRGLGYIIWNSWSLFLAQRMLVAIVIVSLIGVIFMNVVGLVGRLVAPWTRYEERS